MRHVKKVFTACLHATRTGWQLSFSNHDCDALIQAVAVVASVLDGTLEVLAGEVAGSVDSTMRSINRGSSRADDVMSIDDNRGSSRADDVMSMDEVGQGIAVRGLVATLAVVPACVQGRVHNGCCNRAALGVDNGGAAVDASVVELKGLQCGCIHLWMTSERCFSTS